MHPVVYYLTIFALFSGVAIMIRLIVNTASKYFSPVLREISSVTSMPEHFAGVTVLAFGNGAPDVFTVIAARSGNMLTGMNALLGGVVFISTIVLGTICITSEKNLHLDVRNTVRDTVFLIVAITCMVLTVYLKLNVLLLAALYFLLYISYIVVIASTVQVELEEEGTAATLVELDREPPADRPDWERYIDYAFYPFEFLVELAQSASIPVYHIDPVRHANHWAKYSIWFPITIPAVVMAWVGMDHANVWYMLGCVVLSGLLAACRRLLPMPVLTTVHVEDEESGSKLGDIELPSNKQYGTIVEVVINTEPEQQLTSEQYVSLHIWLFVSFVSCILWIDVIAAFLITCLSQLGDMTHIPKSFLGLTVLAWGNSLGDLSTNTTLAAQGKGVMALSACYGGPLFNILFGVGAALLINGMTNTETFTRTVYSAYGTFSLMISVSFMYVILLTTLCMLCYTKFVATPSLGYVLLGLYILYSAIQLFLLVFNFNIPM